MCIYVPILYAYAKYTKITHSRVDLPCVCMMAENNNRNERKAVLPTVDSLLKRPCFSAVNFSSRQPALWLLPVPQMYEGMGEWK